MGRRNSILEELLEQLWELTGYFWQVGAAITLLLSYLTYRAYNWISNVEQSSFGKPINVFFEQLYWLYYFIPLLFLFLTVMFGLKSYASYRKQKGI
ncbi:hypothetical protein I6L35_13960 [Aeromonas sp. FDAARGOS 1405]|uniref:hypothetical protein n=1 Tax=unclassified Aeromonas TaxID=257493 RepID=UPI001C231419|nr:hypothetical protein [Aeromonas sp. FDAARGOS 1405]QXB28404.1 hypothetical protein I6L35_13960 [Aeromonas sp. FDAARGOS 1405]